ncbi:hypothetical protein RvY_01156 [Ramazzottius varieornatus]|uniref:Uncharacterized protein n=1 Tax=Ramazzottius varieornatus TaxID=947166 RepID=A0A1D1UG80_RAMVA|nr:hypothetical protein RvY_01156 [Ramazzottius varieornatus]
MALRQLLRLCESAPLTSVRCLSASATRSADPIQQLFADKVRDYMQKSKAAGGKLVDADAELQKELEESLNRTLRQFGGKSHDEMLKFPSFHFEDPKLDPINMEQK